MQLLLLLGNCDYQCVAVSLATAFWISHQALKTVYDHEDGLNQSPHDITAVKEIIVNKFKVCRKYFTLIISIFMADQRPSVCICIDK